jgi:integrase
MGRTPSVNKNLPEGMRKRVRKSGTYYYLDLGGKPRKELPLGSDYVAAVAQWAEITKRKPESDLLTFRYVAQLYVADILPTKAPRTQQDNLKELEWLYKFFDNPPAPLAEIDPVHVAAYMKWRTAKTRANREKALFSHIWNYARRTGKTNRPNPCPGVPDNKESGRDIYVEDIIYQAVWKVAEQPLRDAMDLAYLTGQRPADVLKMSDNDIIAGHLRTKQNKTTTKLRIAVEHDLAELVATIQARPRKGTALINNKHGSRLSSFELRGAFDRARVAAAEANPDLADEIRAMQFRDLRAKAGTDKEDAEGMEAAQAQLGHSTPTMTADYVRHRLGKRVSATTKRIGKREKEKND